MYAAFAVGQHWDAAVLLVSDGEGEAAKKKISAQNAPALASAQGNRFRIILLKPAAKIAKNKAAIEDLFPDAFYVQCVNDAYRLGIRLEDLPSDGSDMIAARVERQLIQRHSFKELDKQRVMNEMLRVFDTWKAPADLPDGTVERAKALFAAINSAFA